MDTPKFQNNYSVSFFSQASVIPRRGIQSGAFWEDQKQDWGAHALLLSDLLPIGWATSDASGRQLRSKYCMCWASWIKSPIAIPFPKNIPLAHFKETTD